MSTPALIARRLATGHSSLVRRGIMTKSAKRSAPRAAVIQATNVTLNHTGQVHSSPSNASSSQKHEIKQHQTPLNIPFSSSAGLKVKPSKLPSSRTVIHDNEDLLVDMDSLQELASRNPIPLRLNDMYRYAVMRDPQQRLRNAQFLHKELPIRIAQRAVDLLTLPHGLNQSTPIRNVAHIYLRYLNLFENFPSPTTMEEEEDFTEMLTGIMLDRTSIPMDIARGIHSWHDERREDLDPIQTQEMEDALYRFFTARVGLRFLTEHHILSSPTAHKNALRNDKRHANHHSEHDGCIQTDCSPVEEISRMAEKVTRQTKEYYGICPKIEISSIATTDQSNFTYVPHHLQYMLAELLKNSCRATVRTHLSRGLSTAQDEMPEIRVVVVHGAEDVTIKVCDRGGGVPRSTMKQIWKFAHSTREEEGQSEFGTDDITGGHIRGFGLPLCRIYARYFGGDLTLKSMEGYGLDAYLYLPRLGDSCEKMPLSVKASPGAQISMPTGRRAFGTTAAAVSPDDQRLILDLIKSRAL